MSSLDIETESDSRSGNGLLVATTMILFVALCISLFVNLWAFLNPENDGQAKNLAASLPNFALAVIPNFFAGAMGYITLNFIFRKHKRNTEIHQQSVLLDSISRDIRSVSREVHEDYSKRIDTIVDKIRYFDHASDWDGLTGSDKRNYQGNVYQKLESYLTLDHHTLRILSISEVDSRLSTVYQRRKQYLMRIAEHVRNRAVASSPYTYKRVFQLDRPTRPTNVVLEHRDEVLRAKGESNQVSISVKAANLSQRRLHGLVLMEGNESSLLAFIISGIDADTKSYYPVALAVFKSGITENNKMIDYYTRLFEDISNNQAVNL